MSFSYMVTAHFLKVETVALLLGTFICCRKLIFKNFYFSISERGRGEGKSKTDTDGSNPQGDGTASR